MRPFSMQPITVDLAALSRYQRHLAETSPCALDAFNRLGFFDQCDLASLWLAGRDYANDRYALERDDETIGDNM